MIDILQQVATIAQELTAATLFPGNAGTPAAIVYHQYVMPAKPKEIDDVVPFCLVKATAFEIYPSRRQTIEAVFCLYNPDRDEALTDMATLSALLEPLAIRGRPWSGWKIDKVAGYLGDKETGTQPHPYYYLTVVLVLIAPPPKRS
jgi:hypothetical protein